MKDAGWKAKPHIHTILEKKTRNHPQYLGHGQSVWLTIWVDVRFCLPTSVLHLLRQMNVRRGPFERVIVGCTTRALVYDVKGVAYHEHFA
jgi:hypothetical protein